MFLFFTPLHKFSGCFLSALFPRILELGDTLTISWDYPGDRESTIDVTLLYLFLLVFTNNR